MTDERAFRTIQNSYGNMLDSLPYFFENDLISWIPHYGKFDTKELAEKRRQKLEEDPDTVVIGVHEIKRYNPSTNFLVQTGNGDIMPFSEYDPIATARIQQTFEDVSGIYLFYSTPDTEKPEVHTVLMEVKKKH